MKNRFTLKDLERSAVGHLNKVRIDTTVPEVKSKTTKYNNEKTVVDDIAFDSKKEAKRYKDLRILLNAGEIVYLARQVEFNLSIKGDKIAAYVADFVYAGPDMIMIVEDVKSEVTRKLPVFRIKKKMMQALYNIEIQEV